MNTQVHISVTLVQSETEKVGKDLDEAADKVWTYSILNS
ncbi:hypothetical protein SAMN05421640_3186 [Ekhidna lutea]|uniref:Uncharacterized protein n=1 Tax=Ekhidna lutea TaxID=447679 RepID=A0A239LFD1_EKHLU|nr:hypothetical protein SAMN05421640_3186 [Ekhidna lutea]